VARMSWKVYIGLVLVVSSLLLGVVHALVFKDTHTLFFYLALDIVFVPVQVLLVTIIIERLLHERERQSMLNKLNMVIGAFFSEAGTVLIKQMGNTCTDFRGLARHLAVNARWDAAQYATAVKFIGGYECRFNSPTEQLEGLKDFLLAKRSFILGLLQNPNLLEHDGFTDLLWAVCHLSEELEARDDLSALPSSDVKHIESDIQRAFGMLVREWLAYMRHLQIHYPYMYSLFVRINPFNPDASPLVE
jgi:hypothetical protein